jgi:hypothetical protein
VEYGVLLLQQQYRVRVALGELGICVFASSKTTTTTCLVRLF